MTFTGALAREAVAKHSPEAVDLLERTMGAGGDSWEALAFRARHLADDQGPDVQGYAAGGYVAGYAVGIVTGLLAAKRGAS